MKNKLFPIAGALVLLAGCSSSPGWDWLGKDPQAPCSIKDGPFKDIAFDQWPQTYHGTVSGVIDAHLEKLRNPSTADITCTADDYPSMIRANGALQSLASRLAPWKSKSPSELELGPVLLEYLRTYECALQEKRYFLPTSQQSSSSSSGPQIGYGRFVNEEQDDASVISRELATARPLLERTLSIVGGMDRLQPLSLDIECIRRASLDLRNTLGLTAEAAACMPRAWDVRGSLRDLKEESSESTQ